MITGYLFWSRALLIRTLGGWIKLYVARLFRIGPLYLVAAISACVLVFIQTDWKLLEPVHSLVLHIARWMFLGIVPGGALNGVAKPARYLACVTWSLNYEWAFYFSLPLTAMLVRFARNELVAVAGALLLMLGLLGFGQFSGITRLTIVCLSLFLQGMLCAALKRGNFCLALPDWLGSCIVIVLAVLTLQFDTSYGAAPIALLGVAFFLVVSGSSLFGLLKSRIAKLLGDISYGIYLLQGLVFYVIMTWCLRETALSSPAGHWMTVLICSITLTFLAFLTHVFIEGPSIQLGRRIAAVVEEAHPH
jgi:peptidoglycan/LPS O-acetylase OafA/YrhL